MIFIFKSKKLIKRKSRISNNRSLKRKYGYNKRPKIKSNKGIILGDIYRIEDPSGLAHWGMPYKKHIKENRYDVVKFSRSKKKAYKLTKNINPNAPIEEISHVRKRPENVGRKYIGKHNRNYKVDNPMDKSIIRHVRRKNKIKVRG